MFCNFSKVLNGKSWHICGNCLYQNTKYALLDLNPYYLLMKAFSAIIDLDGEIY